MRVFYEDNVDETYENLETIEETYNRLTRIKNINQYNNEMMENILHLELENKKTEHFIILKNSFLQSSDKIVLEYPSSIINEPKIYGNTSSVFEILEIGNNTSFEKWQTKFYGMAEFSRNINIQKRLQNLGYTRAFDEMNSPIKKLYWFK